MASQNRALSPALEQIQSLAHTGQDFSFFQALRLLRLHLGDSAFNELVRVRPHLALAFPEQDIHELKHQAPQWQISANFFGLYGVASPLPTFYTEDLIDEHLSGGSNMRDFLDLIHANLYSLLFDAWQKNRLALAVAEKKHARPTNLLLSLIGLGQSQLHDVASLDRELLAYAGYFNQASRSALGLEALVQGLLDQLPVEVEPCVEQPITVPQAARTALGKQASRLGEDTLLGHQIANRSQKFCIHIGPLNPELLPQLLPTGRLYQRLLKAIRLYVREPLNCVLGLRIQAQNRPPVSLGQSAQGLGQNTWFTESIPGASAAMGRAYDEIYLPLELEANT